MAFYERIYYTVSLALVNYLTTVKGFKIVKVKRDMRNSFVIFFYFEDTPSLREAIAEFEQKNGSNDVAERLKMISDGVWVGEKWEKS